VSSVFRVVKDERIKLAAKATATTEAGEQKGLVLSSLEEAQQASRDQQFEHIKRMNNLTNQLSEQVQNAIESGFPPGDIKALAVSMGITQDKRDCAIRELERLDRLLGTTVKRRPKFTRNVVPLEPVEPKKDGTNG